MSTPTKPFSLRDILTVTTGRLLTQRKGPDDNGIGNLYLILEWLTGEPPYTHTLGRFADECEPLLLAHIPELAKAGEIVKDMRFDADDRWLADLMAAVPELKDTYELPQLAVAVHESKDPVTELIGMVKDPSNITVVIP